MESNPDPTYIAIRIEPEGLRERRDALKLKACPFCSSRQVTIYPFGQGTTSYVEGVPTLYLSSAPANAEAVPPR